MNENRFQLKVGIFVFIALVVLGGLLLNFSKGAALFHPAYNVEMRTPNVGGIKYRASVLMSGVPIGFVDSAKLTEGGRAVDVRLQVYNEFKIPKNSRFVIEQAGFLGDQYVAIYVPTNASPEFLQPGDHVLAPEPFNLQETARAAAGFISRIDDTAKKLNEAIARVDRMVLNEHVLGSLSNTVANLRLTTEGAVATVRSVQNIVDTNTPGINLAMSNLLTAVSNLSKLPDKLDGTVAGLDKVIAHADEMVVTNRDNITHIVKNLDAASGQITNVLGDVDSIMEDLKAGKGLAGQVLKSDASKADVAATLQNLSDLSANLKVASSNLNQHGIWWMLWKPKPDKGDSSPKPTKPVQSGRGHR